MSNPLYNMQPIWLQSCISSYAIAVMGLINEFNNISAYYSSLTNFEKFILSIEPYDQLEIQELDGSTNTIQRYSVVYNEMAEYACTQVLEGKMSKTDIVNGGLYMTARIPDTHAMCAITKITLPKSEMIEIEQEDHWGDRQSPLYVHPSVVDNAELSNYVTTVNGTVDNSYNTYIVDEHDDQPTIRIRHRDARNSRFMRDHGLFMCSSCGNPHYITERTTLDYSGDQICSSCLDDYYTTCPACDEYVNQGTLEDDGCPNCGHNRSSIHDYSYKPNPVFEGVSTRFSPYIGFELEIEATRRSSPKQLASLVNDAFSEDVLYNKYDSSLDSGLEIVSHPLTLDAHAKKNYKDLFDELSRTGARSHNTSTCGLHFHLDKRSMSDAHKVRFGAFFALARHKLEVLARRRSEDYAAFKNKSCSLSEFIAEDNRYLAVNWTNRHTVEVRIFRGTLKYETFMGCMQLCQAIFAFTGKASSFVCDFEENTMWNRFIGFVNSVKGHRYDLLKAYLKEKEELLAKAMEKDEDIQKIEKSKEVKRKKLRLTNNVIRATLERERGTRNGRNTPFLYEPSLAYMSQEIEGSYNYHSTNPVRIDLDDDFSDDMTY